MWTWFWGTTAVDEQVEEKIPAVKKQVKRRVKKVKEELQDVKDAAGAVKGSNKKGRKSTKTVNNK